MGQSKVDLAEFEEADQLQFDVTHLLPYDSAAVQKGGGLLRRLPVVRENDLPVLSNTDTEETRIGEEDIRCQCGIV
jgi:hypothetical protein